MNILQIDLLNKAKGKSKVEKISANKWALKYPCESYISECTPYAVKFIHGKYKIELYGASGGYINGKQDLGGHGAYTSGIINLTSEKIFYFYIGQQGIFGTQKPYNGGGRGTANAGSGGGSTDMRINPGDWYDFQSLKSRIMVAAGGSGGSSHDGDNPGIPGGGIHGFDGYWNECRCKYGTLNRIDPPTGANQTSPGLGGISYDPPSADHYGGHGENGTFGIAGSPLRSDYGSGGSSGYFGGGGGSVVKFRVATGSSGSSFVSGHPNCIAILENSASFNEIYFSDRSIHYSGITFFDPIIHSGNESFSDYKESKNIKGNVGHGIVKITILEYKSYSFQDEEPLLSFLLFATYSLTSFK